MSLPKGVEKVIENIIPEISWDNWEHEEGSEFKYWKVTEVLYAKLDHLRGVIDELGTLPKYADGDPLLEYYDTLEQVQKIIESLQEYELNHD